MIAEKRKFKVTIGYEDCYFGYFHPVKEVTMEHPDARKIKEIGKDCLGNNYFYITWRISVNE